MTFKHPEILYALFALLIPILIHLFQLQRFVKVPFTNVKFLKEIELQTRKSSKLKKFLILMSRMLALAMLIIAFAEPYFAKNDISKPLHTIVYLDNSLSMMARQNQTDLLQQTRQELVENLPQKGSFTLVTNDNVLSDLDRETFKEQLLAVQPTTIPFDAQQRLLGLKNQIQNTEKNTKLLWFSDFQNADNGVFPDFSDLNANLVELKNESPDNVAIDSVYWSKNQPNDKEILVKIKNQGKAIENASLTALQNNIVLSKTNFNIAKDETKDINLRITGNPTQVKLQLDVKDRFSFDNIYYIVFQQIDKIPVLLISPNNSFLNKIFTNDEFSVTQKNSNQIEATDFEKNQFALLNEPENIPQNLLPTLKNFVENGGNLCIIPNPKYDLPNLNLLFQTLNLGQFSLSLSDSLQVNTIHFEHPLMRNVFKKKVTNFQYPIVKKSLISTNKGLPVLSLSNAQPFVTQYPVKKGQVYLLTSSLQLSESNFINSPLVVPVFYQMAILSGLPQQLAYRVGNDNFIKINSSLQKDQVIELQSDHERFIPEQQVFNDFVKLHTIDEPSKAGFYAVNFQDKNVRTLAFNAPKNESKLQFWDVAQQIKTQKNVQLSTNINKTLQEWQTDENVKNYFQWFVFLALLFFLTEIALIKYF